MIGYTKKVESWIGHGVWVIHKNTVIKKKIKSVSVEIYHNWRFTSKHELIETDDMRYVVKSVLLAGEEFDRHVSEVFMTKKEATQKLLEDLRIKVATAALSLASQKREQNANVAACERLERSLNKVSKKGK